MPANRCISCIHDNAHRLIRLNDSLGNLIEYTLDPMGNRSAETRYDPQDVLTQTRTMVFDGLNRLRLRAGGKVNRPPAHLPARPPPAS